MKHLRLLLALFTLMIWGASSSAQTNIIAGWDGGNDTSSPSNFGWTSSANRTLNARNASSGIRMTTNYSGYKLEDGTSYSYSATSDPSSVIFWVRYNTSGESFTYTFQGLEPDHYYDFSALVGWHNNSESPTFTIKINDGTNTFASMSKSVSTKQTLYNISSRFQTPSTITNTTDIKIVFTCNKTGDCMEAISALRLVEVVDKNDLQASLEYANRVNTTLNNSTLASAITTAQSVFDDASATQAQINNAKATLNSAIANALEDASPADMTFVIDNYGFENCTVTTTNAAATGNAAPLDIAGNWTQVNSAAWSSSAVVEYGGTGQVNGASAPTNDNLGNGRYTLGVSVGWGGLVTYQSSTLVFPPGEYTLSVSAYNANTATQFASKFGFVPTTGNAFLSSKASYPSNNWETDEVIFTLSEITEGKIQVGGQAVSGGSGDNAKVFFDNITLTYRNPMAAIKNAWETAKAAAEAARDDSDYENVTGAERTALLAEIAKDEPTTAEGYETATTALQEATSAFIAAKDSYDAFVAMRTTGSTYTLEDWPYASEEKETALNDAITATPTNAEDAVTKKKAIETAFRLFVESNGLAEGVENAIDYTSTYLAGADPETNSGWTNGIGVDNRDWEKYTQGDGDPSGKYYDGGWATNAGVNINMTREITLPAGQYLLQITARGSKNLTSYTMSVGNVSIDLPKDGSGETVGTFGHGWSDKYIVFESDGTAQTLTIAATSEDFEQWISFNRLRLIRLDATLATTEDYANLNDAINAAEAKTLGFDEGEYAPYNNVAALIKLAEAKAIVQSANNAQEDVQALTTYLNNAENWIANGEEVNAVYNGLFATVAEGQNYPDGWTRTNGWGQMRSDISGDYATAYYNQPGSLKYGEKGVYTMPLKANTTYTLKFAYRSHENGSNNSITVSVLNGEDGISGKTFPGNGSTSEWKIVCLAFTTGAAGDYVLTLANSGNTWMTGVEIFKAKPETVTIKSGFNATTYSSEYPLDFTNSGLTAYIITGAENGECITEEVTKVPAATGVYVEGDSGSGEYIVNVYGGSDFDTTSGNRLIGTGAEEVTVTPDNDNTYYMFGKQNNKESFYRVGTERKASAHKAYLAIPGANGAKSLIIVRPNEDIVSDDGGLADGINNVKQADSNAKIYNLNGQRVNNTQKGIYIKNGKKVIIK